MSTIPALHAFKMFLLYFMGSLGVLGAFVWIYIRVTPYDEFKQIREGKVGPAIALVGAMLGYTIPIVTMSYHGVHIQEFLLWAVIACVVQITCFKILYWALPKNIEPDNEAIAVLYAGTSVCVGLVNAFSLIPF